MSEQDDDRTGEDRYSLKLLAEVDRKAASRQVIVGVAVRWQYVGEGEQKSFWAFADREDAVAHFKSIRRVGELELKAGALLFLDCEIFSVPVQEKEQL